MLSQQQKDDIKVRFNNKAKDLFFEQFYLHNQQITFEEAKEITYKLLSHSDTFYSFFGDDENKFEIKKIMEDELCQN